MKFSESHEWVGLGDDIATVGISDYAQKELGDIVYVELPIIGHTVKRGEEIAILESTKAAVAIYTPLSGEIVEINTSLREYPEKVNKSSESEGWLFKLKVVDTSELDELMEESTYREHVEKKD